MLRWRKKVVGRRSCVTRVLLSSPLVPRSATFSRYVGLVFTHFLRREIRLLPRLDSVCLLCVDRNVFGGELISFALHSLLFRLRLYFASISSRRRRLALFSARAEIVATKRREPERARASNQILTEEEKSSEAIRRNRREQNTTKLSLNEIQAARRSRRAAHRQREIMCSSAAHRNRIHSLCASPLIK